MNFQRGYSEHHIGTGGANIRVIPITRRLDLRSFRLGMVAGAAVLAAGAVLAVLL